MYIKINNQTQYNKIREFFVKNGFKINPNLEQGPTFCPEFVFIIKDVKPLLSPHTKSVIWDGTKENVGNNYWDAEKDFDTKIVPFGTALV